jgi:sulfite exporter TauE/SafE
MIKNIAKKALNLYFETPTITAMCSGIGMFSGTIYSMEKTNFKASTIVNFGVVGTYAVGGFIVGMLYPITFPAISGYSMYKIKNL